MPKQTRTGALTTETYAGRVILTLAPPKQPAPDERIEFMVAQRLSMGGQQVGINLDRQPKGVTLAELEGMTFVAPLGGKLTKFTARELVDAIHEMFEAIHDRMTGVTPPPDVAANAQSAGKLKKSRK